MSEWYYQVMGQVMGPVSLDELRGKVEEGEILGRTLVREENESSWTPAGRLEFLFPVGVTTLDEGDEPLDAAALGSEVEGLSEGAAEPREFQRSPLALRPCSDCGQMVSQQALQCPNCGRSFRETSPNVTYRGEQPIPVLLFFSILAILYVVATSMAVYFGAAKLADGATDEGRIALLATGAWLLCMVTCAILGGAVGKPRMAYITGIFLGLFFGPLGLFVAFAIDKRPLCVHCLSRLNGLASECPACHSRLIWKVETSWY